MTYNGWTNYQSWRIGSEILNDEGLHRDWGSDAYDLGYDHEDYGDALGELKSKIIEYFENQVYDLGGWQQDLIQLALEEVDWHEVAEIFDEDIREGVKEALAIFDEED